jgi:pseudouridine synthase
MAVSKKVEPVRINKFIASCTDISRRGADELIKDGKVKVNGKVVTEAGISVTRKDRVEVNGKEIQTPNKIYIVFNKPPGYITTRSDEKGRKTIYENLPENLRTLRTAGRLDKDSTGLLILTNDGDLIQQLTHPSLKVPKAYRVIVEGKLTMEDLRLFEKGIEIEKGKIAKAEAVIISYENNETTLDMVLYQGYNRQIRKMLEAVGHPVLALKRFQHACINLGALKKGKFRFMNNKEVDNLKKYLKNIEKAG